MYFIHNTATSFSSLTGEITDLNKLLTDKGENSQKSMENKINKTKINVKRTITKSPLKDDDLKKKDNLKNEKIEDENCINCKIF